MTATIRDRAISHIGLATERREARSRQRRALHGAPARTMFPVLLDPPEELASYRLWELFGRSTDNLVPLFGERKLGRLLAQLNRVASGRNWHEQIRWRDLSKAERRIFLRELAKHAPRPWREER